MNAKKPKLIILFSGKRKAGKDFLAAALLAKYVIFTFYDLIELISLNHKSILLLKTIIFRHGESVAQIIRISEPIKKHWAKKKELSVDELLGMSMKCWNILRLQIDIKSVAKFYDEATVRRTDDY